MSELANVIEKLSAEVKITDETEETSAFKGEPSSESALDSTLSTQKKAAQSSLVADLISRSEWDKKAALELAYLFYEGHLVPESLETAIEYANHAANDPALKAEAYLLLFNLYVLKRGSYRTPFLLEMASMNGNPDTDFYKAHKIFWGDSRFVNEQHTKEAIEKSLTTSYILNTIIELFDRMDRGESEYSSNPNIKIVRAIKSLTTVSFNFDSVLRAFSPGCFFRGPFIQYDGPKMKMNCQMFKCKLISPMHTNESPKLRDVLLMIPNGHYFVPVLLSRCAPPHQNVYGPIGYTSNVNQYRDSGERFVTPFALVTTELSETAIPLIEKLRTEPSFLKNHFIPFVIDIIEGLVHLHRNNVIFKNISPELMMVKANGSGLLLTGDGMVNLSPPESHKNHSYSRSSDIFFLGISLLSLLCSESTEPAVPLEIPKLTITQSKEINEYFEKIKSLAESRFMSMKDQIPEWCPKGLLDLIANCVEFDHRKRPTLSTLLEYFKACLKEVRALKKEISVEAESQDASGASRVYSNFPYQIVYATYMNPIYNKENLSCCIYGGYSQFWMRKASLLLEDRYTARKAEILANTEQKDKGESEKIQSQSKELDVVTSTANPPEKESKPSPKYADLSKELLLEVGKFLGTLDYLSYSKASRQERKILMGTPRGQFLFKSSIVFKFAEQPLEVPEIIRKSLHKQSKLTELLFRIIKTEKDITRAFKMMQAGINIIETTQTGWGYSPSIHHGLVSIEKIRTAVKTTPFSCPSCMSQETYELHLSSSLEALEKKPFMSCQKCRTWSPEDALLLWGFSKTQLDTIPHWRVPVPVNPEMADVCYSEAVLLYFRKKYPLETGLSFHKIHKKMWESYPNLPAFVQKFILVEPAHIVKAEKEEALIKPPEPPQHFLVMYQKSAAEDLGEDTELEKDEAEISDKTDTMKLKKFS